MHVHFVRILYIFFTFFKKGLRPHLYKSYFSFVVLTLTAEEDFQSFNEQWKFAWELLQPCGSSWETNHKETKSLFYSTFFNASSKSHVSIFPTQFLHSVCFLRDRVMNKINLHLYMNIFMIHEHVHRTYHFLVFSFCSICLKFVTLGNYFRIPDTASNVNFLAAFG